MSDHRFRTQHLRPDGTECGYLAAEHADGKWLCRKCGMTNDGPYQQPKRDPYIEAAGREWQGIAERQSIELRDLRALRDAIPGDDKLATVQWAVKITNAVMAYDAATYGIVRVEAETALGALLYACPISVRAALRGEA